MPDAEETKGEVSEVTIGAHTMRFEPPDLVFGTVVGDVSLEDMRALLETVARFSEGKKGMLALIDMKRMGSISAAARKHAVHAPVSLRGNALFGASFAVRTLTALQARAVRLLYPEQDNPVAAFETEAEARAWLAERRRALKNGIAG